MPEIRQNFASGEWVVVAPERAMRPGDFARPERRTVTSRPEYVATCAFCPGNESQTPPQVLQLPRHGPWQVRVVPNKYPALHNNSPRQVNSDDVNLSLAGVGYHEVVVESRQHNLSPALQTAEQVTRTLTALQMRGRTMAQDRRIRQVVYVKNHGPAAGTSREHPHAQIIALPLLPPRTQAHNETAQRYFEEKGACPFCAMWQAELTAGERLVAESAHLVAFVPYAAPAAYHTWIVPKRHVASFCDALPAEVDDLGELLRDLLRRLYVGLDNPDFNYVIQSAPVDGSHSPFLHWYLAITPRLVPWGGFELGTGMFINTALPEENARFLREVVI